MALDERKKEIDGLKYTVVQFTATKSIRLMKRIVSLVGESLLYFASGGSEDVTEKQVVSAVRTLIARLDEDDIVELIKDMLEGVTAEGGKVVVDDFDLRFAGKLGHLTKVISFVLEVQYRDFFDVARSSVKGRTQSESDSKASETGPAS